MGQPIGDTATACRDFKLDGGADDAASEHTASHAASVTGNGLLVPIAPKAPLQLLPLDPLPANLSQQVAIPFELQLPQQDRHVLLLHVCPSSE